MPLALDLCYDSENLLTGGEPLTHPQFREIYTALRNMGLVVSVNTNGTLIDADMVAFLEANPPTKVIMSLYGASRETYNELCRVPAAYDWATGEADAGEFIDKLAELGAVIK